MRKLLASLVVVVAGLGNASAAMANDGGLDTSWGGTGIVRIGRSDYDFVPHVSPYGPSGVQVIGNFDSAGSGGPYDATVLMRFTVDGGPDPSCGGTGRVSFAGVDPVSASDMVVLDDGSTIVVGTIESSQPQGLILKYTPTCQLDPTFGSGGVVSFISREGVRFSSVDIRDHDRIVVGGLTLFAPVDGGDSRLTVARFTSSGQLDTSFGAQNDGVFVSDGTREGRVSDLKVDSLGRVLFVGIQNLGTDDDAVVGRLTNTGRLDSSFASAGWFTRTGVNIDRFSATALRANGGLIAVGVHESTGFVATLVCLDALGAIDNTCGTSGVVNQLALPSGVVDFRFWTVVVDDMGRFVISGIYDDPYASGSGVTPMVVRLLADGSPDPTFGSGGLISAQFTPGHASHVALDQLGRILVSGHEFVPNGFHGPIVRLTASTTTSTTTTTSTSTTTTTSVPNTSTIAPQLLPATGDDASGSWAVVVMALGLGLLLVRRYAVNHSAK
ncbi:MAG: hypothetical protein RLZ19_953 [Actinomycetota bacterium]|jgi:uncharacterized delta-60 repeat protein